MFSSVQTHPLHTLVPCDPSQQTERERNGRLTIKAKEAKMVVEKKVPLVSGFDKTLLTPTLKPGCVSFCTDAF